MLKNEGAGVTIHPTAIVEEGAVLGEGVSIGPFCCIGADVVIAAGCKIMSHSVVMGHTHIGKNTTVFPHAVLGGPPQNNKHKGGKTFLYIGEGCVIREGVTMHCGSDSSLGKTVVGNYGNFLAYSHVAHDCVIGNYVTFANNVKIGGHVEIGDYVMVGGGAAIHQFVRVGHNACVGGMAALLHDLIPYGLATGVQAYFSGLNIIGMKRVGMSRSEILCLHKATKMLFDYHHPLKTRIEEVRVAYADSPLVLEMLSFFDHSNKRSYCLPPLQKVGN